MSEEPAPESKSLSALTAEIEGIIASLESDPELELAIEQYEQGVKLMQLAEKKLYEAEQRVRVLSQGSDEPVDFPDDDDVE